MVTYTVEGPGLDAVDAGDLDGFLCSEQVGERAIADGLGLEKIGVAPVHRAGDGLDRQGFRPGRAGVRRRGRRDRPGPPFERATARALRRSSSGPTTRARRQRSTCARSSRRSDEPGARPPSEPDDAARRLLPDPVRADGRCGRRRRVPARDEFARGDGVRPADRGVGPQGRLAGSMDRRAAAQRGVRRRRARGLRDGRERVGPERRRPPRARGPRRRGRARVGQRAPLLRRLEDGRCAGVPGARSGRHHHRVDGRRS